LPEEQRQAVLVVGKLHPHTIERIDGSFRMLSLDSGDAGLITPEIATSVVGLSAMITRIDAALIDALPRLEIIANFGVGYDTVDARHAARKGIMVTNTPDVLNEEVADVAIGLLINTVRELPRAEAWLRAGRWESDGPYRVTPMSLRGRSVGIFGLGRIGRAIARRLEAFGLPVSYHNRRQVEDVPYRYCPSLLELAHSVDTLVCVAPGGPETERAVNMDVLRALGPDGVFINVGRGSTVDEEALAAALAGGTIRAAGLDVFANEPHVPEALLRLDNASLLPHVASASQSTRRAMADLVADNLVSWFADGRALTPVPECAHISRRPAA
jgi:lactate dehydrogenase-like 2-hydroxyacid dehydrogenase